MPNPSLERDLHRHGTWPAKRSLSSSASRAKRHAASGPSAQTLGLTLGNHLLGTSVLALPSQSNREPFHRNHQHGQAMRTSKARDNLSRRETTAYRALYFASLLSIIVCVYLAIEVFQSYMRGFAILGVALSAAAAKVFIVALESDIRIIGNSPRSE